MMKKFLVRLSYTVFPLWLLVIILMVYYNLLILPNINGDLGRLGKLAMPPYIQSDYEEKFFENIVDEHGLKDTVIDVLTIGDSFSQQGANGYQNYLAQQGLSVLNFTNRPHEPFQMLYDLMNLNYVDSVHVKTIVVESVERAIVSRLKNLDKSNDSIKAYVAPETNKDEPKWSLAQVKNFVLLRMGYENPVKHLQMSRKLFSGPDGDELYFYYQDISDFSVDEKDYRLIQKNIESLMQKADSLGIRLVFLVCPDKFDVYQDEIIDNPYPRKTVNEDLKKLFPYQENLLVAKDLIIPYVRKGELDYYHFNDTHWSHKSAKVVADELLKRYCFKYNP